MQSQQISDRRIIIQSGAMIFRVGMVINVQNEFAVNEYVVLSNEANGDAILEILKDDVVAKIKRLIDQAEPSQKKYRGTYNSKHGRSW